MSVSTPPGRMALARTCGPNALASPTVRAFRPGLGAGVDQLVRAGPQRADRGDVDDAAAPGRGHPGPSHHPEPERALEVHALDLVVVLLGDRGQVRVPRGHPGVVHQHVAAAEFLVDGVDQPVAVGPAGGVELGRDRRAPGARADLPGGFRAAGQLAAGDHHVRRRPPPSPAAMARPMPRLPPVITATRPSSPVTGRPRRPRVPAARAPRRRPGRPRAGQSCPARTPARSPRANRPA